MGLVDSRASVVRMAGGHGLASELYSDLAGQRLAGCEMHERFYEIGSPAGVADTGAVLPGVTAVTREGYAVTDLDGRER